MRTFLAILVVCLGLASLAVADTVSFAGGGNLGTSHTYNLDTANVVATGFVSSFITGNLFGKSGPGDESGLGLKSDPSGQDEIWYATSITPFKDFIQLNVSDLLNKGYTNIQFEMGSTSGGEKWSVSACSFSGVLCSSSPVTGSGDLSFHGAPSNLSATNHYLDFTSISPSGGGNVLLVALSATPDPPSTVPEPRFYGLLLASMVGFVGIVVRSRRTVHA
jgi:hypothetical protein